MHFRFRASRPQRVFALERRDRLDRVGAANRLRSCFGKAEVLDLAFAESGPLPLPPRLRSARPGQLGADRSRSMASTLSRLSEASATSLICSGRLSSPACLPVFWIEFEPELGGDHHLPAEGSEGFTHEFFVGERAVDFSRIEECDAAFDGCPDNRDHLLLVFGRTVAEAHSHAAEADGRDFQVRSFQVCASASFLLRELPVFSRLESSAREAVS